MSLHIKIIKMILPFLLSQDNNFKWRYLTGILLIIITIALNVITPITLKNIINHLGYAQLQLTIATGLIFCSFGAIWTLSKITSQLRQIVMYRVFEQGIRLLGVKLFDHLSDLSMRYHHHKKTGAIVNAVDRAQTALPNVFWGLFFLIIPTLLEMIFAGFILSFLYGFIYGFSLLSVLGIFLIFTLSCTRRVIKIQKLSSQTSQEVGAYLVDRLINYETLKCLLIDKNQEIARCNQVFKEREIATARQMVALDLVGAGQALIIGLGITLLTFIAAKGVNHHILKVADYVLINGYLLQFANPLNLFGFIFRQMRQGLTDLESVVEILEEKPEINDKIDAKDLICSHGEVIFDQVDFRYEKSRPVFKNISFIIPAGNTTAVVGPTGCGKSTLSRLLMRLYDVQSGAIRIDGEDIRNCTQQSLRSIIGIVPQDSVLFNASIYFNITYSLPLADLQAVENVIELVNLKSFIASLPQGYDTVVGERGLTISGGERQRIAIARALLKKPKLFIFDEATSALDVKTEKMIQENLRNISKSITTLIIAHRLSTITHADNIIVLDSSGFIAEQGTHQFLLNHRGLYANLWQQQIQQNVIDGMNTWKLESQSPQLMNIE